MVNWLAHEILLSPSFSWWFPSYPLNSLFLVLNSNIISEHEVKSSLSISPCEWAWVNTEYRIHRALHTPSTASSQDCLCSLHCDDCELTPECSFSFRRASLQDRPPPASSPSELKGKVTSSYSHGCKLTNWWIESQHLAHHLSTASKYSPYPARSWPSSASPILLDHSLQVNLRVTRSRPPNASPNLLDRGLQVHLWVQLDLGLQVHLQTRSITASKCISEFTWSRPPSASPNSLDHGLQVHLQTRMTTASKCISKLTQLRPPNSLDHGLQVHLQIHSITASKCISKYARLPPPSASPNSLDHGLGVYLWVHSIVIFRCTLNCTQAPPAASPDIPCVDG